MPHLTLGKLIKRQLVFEALVNELNQGCLVSGIGAQKQHFHFGLLGDHATANAKRGDYGNETMQQHTRVSTHHDQSRPMRRCGRFRGDVQGRLPLRV